MTFYSESFVLGAWPWVFRSVPYRDVSRSRYEMGWYGTKGHVHAMKKIFVYVNILTGKNIFFQKLNFFSFDCVIYLINNKDNAKKRNYRIKVIIFVFYLNEVRFDWIESNQFFTKKNPTKILKKFDVANSYWIRFDSIRFGKRLKYGITLQ